MNASRLRTRRHLLPVRVAFTLTELLAVIAIIGILASSVLFAMWGAIEMAKEARTRTQITKLNELLMTRWEGYRHGPSGWACRWACGKTRASRRPRGSMPFAT
jgi:prepilin-type N-terminal cleavage/methylation domain-containing protein